MRSSLSLGLGEWTDGSDNISDDLSDATHATIVSTDDHSVMSTITQRCRRRDGCHPSRRISCPVLRSSIRHRVRHASLMGSMIRCAQSLWLVVASGGIATRVAHPERDGPTGSGTPCGWGPSPFPRRGFGPTAAGPLAPPALVGGIPGLACVTAGGRPFGGRQTPGLTETI